MANAFEDEREFVSGLQGRASSIYRDFFGPHNRYPVEEIGDGELEKQLDYSGTDQILKKKGEPKTIHVAQRFRRRRSGGRQTDFSLRCRSNGHATEYQKLLLNHGDPIAHTPGLYAFGIADDGRFDEFYFLNVGRLVEALQKDALSKERHKNFVGGKPDGTEAYYIPIDELRSNGIVLSDFEGGERRL